MRSRKFDRQQITKLIEVELKTLKEIGQMFGVSGEAIRQAYFKETGKNVATNRKKREIRNTVKNLKSRSFSCINCGKYVDMFDHANRNNRKYCKVCTKIVQFKNRDLARKQTCLYCKKEFNPFRSILGQGKFCSSDCYWNSRILSS